MDFNKFESAIESSENEIECDEALSENVAPPNLETLNSDCQQLILDYFEIKDLLNVAETSKTLHVAACVAFKRKYGQGNVGLGGLYQCPYEKEHFVKYVS